MTKARFEARRARRKRLETMDAGSLSLLPIFDPEGSNGTEDPGSAGNRASGSGRTRDWGGKFVYP